MRNCSGTHLPSMATQCSAELEEERSFDKYLENVQQCFYKYVQQNDLDGHIQSDIKKLMAQTNEMKINILDSEGILEIMYNLDQANNKR